MELKPLSEVDLREAIGPINRAVTGHYIPSVRTVSYLRERAQCGVLDLKLSRCAFIGRDLVGACLVDRVDEWAHLDALGVDPLAQQRGVGHALLEAACVAAEAAGVARISAEISESDGPAMATLTRVGFVRQRELGRWALQGAPVQHPLPMVRPDPDEAGGEASRATPGQLLVQRVELSEALQVPPQAPLPFGKQPGVLTRLRGRLTSYLLMQMEASEPVVGAAVLDRERHEIVSLRGSGERLLPIVALLCLRHGATHYESVPDDDPVTSVLTEAGLRRVSVRAELIRSF